MKSFCDITRLQSLYNVISKEIKERNYFFLYSRHSLNTYSINDTRTKHKLECNCFNLKFWVRHWIRFHCTSSTQNNSIYRWKQNRVRTMILHVPICFLYIVLNVVELSVKIIAYFLPERVPARGRIILFICNGFDNVFDFEYLTLAYIQFW